jgi:hypothetical protein
LDGLKWLTFAQNLPLNNIGHVQNVNITNNCQLLINRRNSDKNESKCIQLWPHTASNNYKLYAGCLLPPFGDKNSRRLLDVNEIRFA